MLFVAVLLQEDAGFSASSCLVIRVSPRHKSRGTYELSTLFSFHGGTRRIALLLCTSAAFAACAPETRVEDLASLDDGALSELALHLDLAPGLRLSELSYEIGGNHFFKFGTVDVSQTAQALFLIYGIPAGNDYAITLQGSTEDVSCLGAGSFSVRAGAVSDVRVALRCEAREGKGGVAVSASTNVCPQLSEFSVSSLSAPVGHRCGRKAAGCKLSLVESDREARVAYASRDPIALHGCR